MKVLLINCFFGFVVFSSCHSTAELQVEHIKEVDYGFPAGCEKDSCNSYYYIYLVNGYSESRNRELLDLMDSIVCIENKEDIGYDLFGIYVLRYSRVSNKENWRIFPKDLDRESISNDLVLAYIWRDGILSRKSKFRRRGYFRPNELIETELPLEVCR